MRWIAQAETALDMMVDRSIHRYSHGSTLAEKQGVQWMIADSAMELYQCKLMVLHTAYKIDRGDDFRTEVSMTKHFVANSLNRIIDRAIQVHGALGYSTDTPLASMLQHARWARLADGADEIHQMRIAERTIAPSKTVVPRRWRRVICPSNEVSTFAVGHCGPRRWSEIDLEGSSWLTKISINGSIPWWTRKRCSRHETPEDVTRLALIEETLDQCWICCANVVRCVNSGAIPKRRRSATSTPWSDTSSSAL